MYTDEFIIGGMIIVDESIIIRHLLFKIPVTKLLREAKVSGIKTFCLERVMLPC